MGAAGYPTRKANPMNKLLTLLALALVLIGTTAKADEYFHEVIPLGAEGTSLTLLSAATNPTVGALSGVTDPEVPRNVGIVITDANNSITKLVVVVKGLNQFGMPVTEVFTKSATETLTLEGVIPFSDITTATIQTVSGNGSTDRVALYKGNKFGFITPINRYDDVKHATHVTSPTAEMSVTSATVSAPRSTLSVTPSTAMDFGSIWGFTRGQIPHTKFGAQSNITD